MLCDAPCGVAPDTVLVKEVEKQFLRVFLTKIHIVNLFCKVWKPPAENVFYLFISIFPKITAHQFLATINNLNLLSWLFIMCNKLFDFLKTFYINMCYFFAGYGVFIISVLWGKFLSICWHAFYLRQISVRILNFQKFFYCKHTY